MNEEAIVREKNVLEMKCEELGNMYPFIIKSTLNILFRKSILCSLKY